MSISIFGYFMAGEASSRGGAAVPRLRDLIAGLLSRDIAATTILARLDPNLSDEIRAMITHRGINAESFLASALMAFALDVADESWRRAVSYRESAGEDAEAAAFADLLSEVMRQRLEREVGLGWAGEDSEPHMALARRIG